MLEIRDMIDNIIEEGNTVIDWNDIIEYVTIEHLNTGDVYHFQGDDYTELYSDYENSAMFDEFYFDEYLYYVSQSW